MIDSSAAVAPIRIRRAWSGGVVLAAPQHAGDADEKFPIPNLRQWTDFLVQLVTDPAALPDRTVLKHSAEARVFRTKVATGNADLHVVCKNARGGGFGRRLARLLFGGPQRRNFLLARRLSAAGVPTPAPLAYLQRRGGTQGWLITQYVPGLVELDDVALTRLSRLDARRLREVKAGILHAVSRMLKSLKQARLIHRDLKATNIMLSDWGRPERVAAWIVDLDGLRPRRIWDRAGQNKVLVRLAASLLHYDAVTRSDCMRFLRLHFAGKKMSRPARKQLFRTLAGRAVRYVQRAYHRKRDKLDGFGAEK